ncbi:MAG: transposase [Thioploca sp.]|nr:transposase [Thioploca sp.]
MPRKPGYAPVGERGVGQQNWHARGRLHVVGALRVSCWFTVSLVSGTINANTFYAWVAQDLLLQLPPHSIVVMDKAAFHQRVDIQQLFKQAGHVLEYWPAYSPDLNPIEHKWAQAKAIRKPNKCSVEERFAHSVL